MNLHEVYLASLLAKNVCNGTDDGDNSIGLSEYVKKTDYPTSVKTGVVAVNQALGLGVNDKGTVSDLQAQINELKAKIEALEST